MAACSSITSPALADGVSSKRKHGTFIERTADKFANKRNKIMGRPKNAWTPSKSRKLVRLYLMTSLAVADLAKVLRTNYFAPCTRDIQKQLQTLLQSRPTKIRSRGVMTKVRLHHLRECRVMENGTTSQLEKRDRGIEIPAVNNSPSHRDPNLGSLKSSQTTPSGLWLDTMDELNTFGSSHAYGTQRGRNDEYIESTVGVPEAPLSPSKINTLPHDDLARTRPGPSSISTAPFSTLRQSSLHSNASQLLSRITISPLAPQASKPCEPAVITTHVTTGEHWQGLPGTEVWDPEELPEGRRIITFETKSCRRDSIPSIGSLRRRLGTETESCLEDVRCVLQDLTISGSTKSHPKSNRTNSFKASSYTTSNLDEKDSENIGVVKPKKNLGFISQEKVLLNHEVLLPGNFIYCLPNTSKNSSIWQLIMGPCLLCQIGASNSMKHLHVCNNIQPWELSQVDVYGNTVLHIAATSAKKLQSLLYLINLGADIHAVNSARQTFLHLISVIEEGECTHLYNLLKMLQHKSFGFHLRDDHGQTGLHHITRQWMDEAALAGITNVLVSSKIIIPSSRDNLGRTILEQIKDIGLDVPQIDHLQLQAVINIMAQERCRQPQKDDSSLAETRSSEMGHRPLSNYGPCTLIETIEDLQRYEVHADLLRTIVKAISIPQHEDKHGRNGLHCLAEVSLTLPIPCQPPSNTTDNGTDIALSRREAYLSDLLEAGVDPDNCDKKGLTPLMAFLLHSRDDDDDNTMIRILTRLLNAGANINRRNREGQTPLHIAVKMGRTAATRLLLRTGANIHVRDSEGKGVIVVGQVYSKNALTDTKLYASIMMCISHVVDAGAVSAPSRLQEWGTKFLKAEK